nr:zinc carboxypeptidase [Segetibacter sp.]
QLVSEFKKFFDNGRNAVGSNYKTYILTSNDSYKITSVKNLLDRNGIEYGAFNGKVKGFHYFSGKDEEGTLQKYSLAISAYQPKSTLVKVLFEPKAMLTDSVTYDITAWAVPYAYGVDAFALKDKKILTPYNTPAEAGKINSVSSYGVLIPYSSINSAKVLAYLLKKGVKVRMAEKPFTYNNKNFDRGTLIIIKTSNAANWLANVNEAANLYQVQPIEVNSGYVDRGPDFGSPDVRVILAPKVALLTGKQTSSTGAGEVWHFFDQTLDYPITLINTEDVAGTDLKSYDVLIIPNGNYRQFIDKSTSEKLKEFVRSGGRLIAMQNAVEQLAAEDWGIKPKDLKDEKLTGDSYNLLKKYSERERENVDQMPGAIYKVELDNTHPLAFGYPENYYTLRQDSRIYEFMNEGWNVGVIKKNELVSGFVGYKLKNKLKDGLLFGVQQMGSGSVIYMADDPLFRLFWENGKLLFSNAVFLVGR